MGLHCLQVPHKGLQYLPMFNFWGTRQSGLKCIGTSLYSMYKTGHKVIKLFFVLNSTEYEIFPTHKC